MRLGNLGDPAPEPAAAGLIPDYAVVWILLYSPCEETDASQRSQQQL